MGAIAIRIGKRIIHGLIAGTVIGGGILLLSIVPKEIADVIARGLSDANASTGERRNCGCPPRIGIGPSGRSRPSRTCYPHPMTSTPRPDASCDPAT